MKLRLRGLAVLACVACAQSQGLITTIAGTDVTYPNGEFPANSTTFGTLTGVAVHPVTGEVYFASRSRSLILKFNPTKNTVTVVAGVGLAAFSGDGGPASNAALNNPFQIAFDPAGNLYIADFGNNRVRKIDSQGMISTLVVHEALGVAVAPDGSLAVSGNNAIVRANSDGTIMPIAGTGSSGFSGDGGPAVQASVGGYLPAVAFDQTGNLFLNDAGNYRIRRIDTNGIISTIAGNGLPGRSVNGPALSSPLNGSNGLAVDSSGNVFFGSGGLLVQVDPQGNLTALNPQQSSFFLASPGPLSAAIVAPQQLALSQAGDLYVTDFRGYLLLVTAGSVQAVAAYAPSFGIGDQGPASSATLSAPQGLALLPDGSLLIADSQDNRVRRLSSSGTIDTFAGTGTPGRPSPGLALTASLDGPSTLAVDPAGNTFFGVDPIGKIDPSGNLSIFSKILGAGLASDLQGNLLLANPTGSTVLRILPDGTQSVFAGNGQAGFSGDGGPATSAQLSLPQGETVCPNGDVFIADGGNNRVRKVSADGTISTVASSLASPQALACDAQGNVYIAEYGNRVRKLASDGSLAKIAGTGIAGFSGDGGPSTTAMLNVPLGIAVDADGNVYIADTNNNRIRKILAAPAGLTVSSSQVTISGVSQGAPVQATVQVNSTAPGLVYSIGFQTDTGSWLSFGSLQGTAPGVLTINADPGALTPGTYQGTITLSSPYTAPPALTIAVTFQVAAPPAPNLSLQTPPLLFTFTGNTGTSSQQLKVNNLGGGTVSFTASASTASGGAWLSVTPQNGNVAATRQSILTVTASPAGLSPGTYNGTIKVISPDTGQTISIPATLAISAPLPQIVLSQTGLTFTAVSQGGTPLAQSVGILNGGSGTLNWTAKATTVTGSGWLTVSAASGTVPRPMLDVSFVDINVNAQSLVPGVYYGRVDVSSAAASNSPQSVTVVLNVLEAGANPGPQIRPTGLVFTGVTGGVNPGAQNVFAANLTATPITYGSSPTYIGDGGYLAYLPLTSTIVPNTPLKITVQPTFDGVTPGIRRAALTFAFDDGSVRTVSILSVIAPAAPANSASEGAAQAAAGCVPTKLIPAFTQLGPGAGVPAGWPVDVLSQVVDDCGSPLTSGSVVAHFSNGDPALSLINLQGGRWSGTWQPRNSALSDVVVSLNAQQSASGLTGSIQSTVSVKGVQRLPVLAAEPANAVTQAAGPLAPGEIVLITGADLADGPGVSAASPVPQSLAGASVLIGGRLMPLLYADPSRLVALVPSDLPVNQPQQMVVAHGSTLGLPSTIITAAAMPAIFTADSSGSGQGLVYRTNGGTATALADTGNPASPGDTVILYCTGLGTLDAAGKTANPVSVSIGGQPAQVTYAGAAIPGNLPPAGAPPLIGGLVSSSLGGLYQITATVPAVDPGAAQVNVTIVGQTSQPNVTIVIAK